MEEFPNLPPAAKPKILPPPKSETVVQTNRLMYAVPIDPKESSEMAQIEEVSDSTSSTSDEEEAEIDEEKQVVKRPTKAQKKRSECICSATNRDVSARVIGVPTYFQQACFRPLNKMGLLNKRLVLVDLA